MNEISQNDASDFRCKQAEAGFRSRLLELEILLDERNTLSNTTLRFDVAELTEGKFAGRLRFRLSGGNHVRTYTCRQSPKGFNEDLIVEKVVGLYRKELECSQFARERDNVVKQAAVDADAINAALGLEPHHFPRVMANKNGVPLTISAPEGLTAEQAKAALKAIYDNRPSDLSEAV